MCLRYRLGGKQNIPDSMMYKILSRVKELSTVTHPHTHKKKMQSEGSIEGFEVISETA